MNIFAAKRENCYMTKDDMKKLYPITKLFICLALLFSLFIISSYIYNYCMAIICGVIAVGFGVSLKTYAKRIFLLRDRKSVV